MNTLTQKFLALFSTSGTEHTESPGSPADRGGMPLASVAYLREFAQRLRLEVDDLSPAEQAELKRRLDESMDFREDNYGFLYHEVYRLGHGYSLADAKRVSAQLTEISEEPAARAYLDYRENAVAAEALMAAGSLLQEEGEAAAADRLFRLADARRHRSSLLADNTGDAASRDTDRDDGVERQGAPVADTAVEDSPGENSATEDSPAEDSPEAGLAGLMDDAVDAGADAGSKDRAG